PSFLPRRWRLMNCLSKILTPMRWCLLHVTERTGNGTRALEYARIAVKRAPQDEIAQARLAEVLAASLKADERSEAREILWAVAAKKGAGRKSAIESLARAPDLTTNEQRKILD